MKRNELLIYPTGMNYKIVMWMKDARAKRFVTYNCIFRKPNLYKQKADLWWCRAEEGMRGTGYKRTQGDLGGDPEGSDDLTDVKM